MLTYRRKGMVSGEIGLELVLKKRKKGDKWGRGHTTLKKWTSGDGRRRSFTDETSNK